MSVAERIALAAAAWDSIAAEPHPPLLTEEQRREIERRLADHAANPHDVVEWEPVKSEALSPVPAMSLPIVFRRAARGEFDAAADWDERTCAARTA